MAYNFIFFFFDKIISFLTFSFILLNFQSKKSGIFLQSINGSLHCVNFFLILIIFFQHLFVFLRILFSISHILSKTLFKSSIKLFNFFDKTMLHLIQVFHILVSSFFSISFKCSLHFIKFGFFFFFYSLYHISKFLFFLIVRHFDFPFFCVEFCFYDIDITIEFFL